MYNITASIAQNCTYHKSILILLSKLLKKSANITYCSHKSTYGFVLLGTVIISLIRQGALQNSHCAALPGSIIGHTNSGQFISSLLSDLCAQLFCLADTDFTIISLFLFDGLGRLECRVRGIQNNT